MADNVNHPAHYNMGPVEVIDALEAWQLGLHEGNVVKYVARAKHKGHELEDLMKARWYLDRRIKQFSETPIASEKRIYVASRQGIESRPDMWRTLRNGGWPIISTWIDMFDDQEPTDLRKMWNALRNEIESATHFIFYAESDDFPLKGALVEAGIAISKRIPVFVCLPNVELEGRTFRPIGSWIAFDNVIRDDNLSSIRKAIGF